MSHLHPQSGSLEDVLITEQLSQRSPRTPDLKAENQALRTLAQQLVEHPNRMLKTLAAIAKDLCQAGTAGVSLLEIRPNGEEVFRWVALCGALAEHEQEIVPRHSSPCGICLNYQSPQLYAYPARYFTYLQPAEPEITEGLVIPLLAHSQSLGAIWIVSHDPHREFDAEDVRIMTSLADFTAAAIKNQQREETLQQREAELSLVTNSVPALISFVDAEQRYRFNNRTYEEWFGHSESEVYGKALWEVLGEAAYQTIQPYVEQALAGQQVTFESEISYQNAEIRYISATYVPRFDAEGNVTGFVALVSDISERKQVEIALHQSEEQTRLAIRVGRLGTWRYSLENNLVELDQRMREIWGEPEDAERIPLERAMQRIHPEDRERVAIAINTALDPGSSGTYEMDYRIVWDDDTERWLLAYGQVQFAGEGESRHPVDFLGTALDITDRKQAEAALATQEQRYRYIFEAVNVPIMEEDFSAVKAAINSLKAAGIQDFRQYFTEHPEFVQQAISMVQVRDVNQASLQLFGAQSKTELLQSLEQIFTPETQDAFVAELFAIASEETYFAAETVLQTLQGDRRYVWFTITFPPPAEPYDQVLVSLLDITDRKRAEEALAQNEAQLRLIIESAKEYAIFTLNMDNKITRWNSGAQRLLGFQESEIVGQDGRIIFISEDLERGAATHEIHKALTEGRAENERWHVRKDSSRFWGSGLMMPLRGEDDQIEGFLKILQDKTAQRQADERLHLLYETTRDLLATEHPMMLLNNVFSKLSVELELHHYYAFMVEEKDNQLMLHLKNYSGISEETAQDLTWIEFDRYLCGQVAQQRRPMILNQGQIASYPAEHFIHTLGVSAYAGYPLVAQNRLLGTLSFASLTRTSFTPEEIDLMQVTCAQIAIALERANLIESLQQQTEQLQQANRIKDEFLAVLSHELRSPLNPILGWARLLQSRKLNETRTIEALASIERNARLQAELIEDLLDVSRILRGKLSLNMIPVNLTFTIRAAMETVRLAAEAKSIQIHTDLDPAVGRILGDPARIQQVIWNLLSNAVKFTPAGGQVEVRLEQVAHRQADESMRARSGQSPSSSPIPFYAQITVSDTGNGIAAEFLPHVFDYFRQADSATTRRFGGLGLGLAIVRHLVELHGGTVHADSPGEEMGATFIVRLPLLDNPESGVRSQNDTDAELPVSHSPLSNLQILVVDDDTDTRAYTTFLLEQAGAQVTAVASATEGFAALTQFKPDLLLSDVGMPETDGYMLLRQMRALPPEQGGNIPAIALTAYAGEINQQQALDAGFQMHLAKPVTPEVLVQAISELLHQP